MVMMGCWLRAMGVATWVGGTSRRGAARASWREVVLLRLRRSGGRCPNALPRLGVRLRRT